MKKALFLTLSLLASISFASESSKREAVIEFLEVTNVSSMVDTVYAQMDQMMYGLHDQFNVSEEEKEIFDKYMTKHIELIKSEMSWSKMKQPIIDIYVNNFTEKEIRDAITFYKTDSGRSILSKMPAVIQDTTIISQEMMRNTLPKMQQLAHDLGQELQEKRKS